MAIPELEVLEATPTKDDQSQWPEFTLKSVKVTFKETGGLASLLSAHGGSLLRVEGQLGDVDPDYAHLLKHSKHRKRTIEIDDVSLYSFSQYDDGSLGFWAAGRAGWYEIGSAAPRYQPIFDGMAEATGMFYYLADKYRNSRSKLLKEAVRVQDAHVRHIFYDYASSDYCKRVDIEDIRDGFYEHHNFLMKSMLEGQEGLEWESSPVLRHLKRRFPADFRTIQRVVLGESPAQGDAIKVEPDEVLVTVPAKISKTRSQSGRSKSSRSVLPTDDSQTIDEDEEVSESGIVTPPAREGKRKSHLRPRSERSAKRFSKYDTRTTRSQDASQEDVDMHNGSSDATSGSDTDVPPDTVADAAAIADAMISAVESPLATRKAPKPSYYEPKGPGDTWTCPYDGCNQKVWDARSPGSIELMKAHFVEKHEDSMEDLINSESRPWAGVSHLLQRVKGFAAANSKTNGKMIDDKALPERIVRRY